MINNKYIDAVKNYVIQYTPIDFIFYQEKYDEIYNRIINENVENDELELLCASYTLFYTALTYHKKASADEINQPYYILIGDYISSYVAELLYKNKLFEILKIFTLSTKKIMLNLLNNIDEDSLLDDIINAVKGRWKNGFN